MWAILRSRAVALRLIGHRLGRAALHPAGFRRLRPRSASLGSGVVPVPAFSPTAAIAAFAERAAIAPRPHVATGSVAGSVAGPAAAAGLGQRFESPLEFAGVEGSVFVGVELADQPLREFGRRRRLGPVAHSAGAGPAIAAAGPFSAGRTRLRFGRVAALPRRSDGFPGFRRFRGPRRFAGLGGKREGGQAERRAGSGEKGSCPHRVVSLRGEADSLSRRAGIS